MRSAIRPFFVIALIVLVSAVAPLVDAPDACFSFVSGLIEAVDTTWSGNNYNVRSTQMTSTGEQISSTILTSHAAHDLDPRVAVAGNGDVLVVWWRDLTKDALIYRKRSLATGAWGAERVAGAATESNSHPRIAYANDKPWVAYQIQNSKSRSVGCQIIDEDVEPFRSIVATTTYPGPLDTKLSSESRHLWVSWIDNGSSVGYSEYAFDKQLWSTPAFESFASDTITAARARIRNRVLGL